MTARRISTAGAEIALDDLGVDDPALVFLHYWGGSARTWDPVIDLLPERVHKVVLDQRGWGGSRAMDGRYDLDALADDVTDVVGALGIERYMVVGHSMGGKVAQILAGRRPKGLAGLVLVAPAPPAPMQVPAEMRAGMLESYQSREGVLQALQVLAGSPLDERRREQVVADTLRGEPGAKRHWPEHGMMADLGPALEGLAVPVTILVGDRDQVERETTLRPLFSRLLPHATFTVVRGAGHLLPLEAPRPIARACESLL